MNPDPHLRPTFAEVLDVLEPLRDLAERGQLKQASLSPPDEGRKQMGALLGSVKKIEEGEEDARGSANGVSQFSSRASTFKD